MSNSVCQWYYIGFIICFCFLLVRTGMMIAGTDTTIVDMIMDLPEEDHMTGPHQEGIMTPIWIDALPLAEIIIVVMVIITEVAALQGPLQGIDQPKYLYP